MKVLNLDIFFRNSKGDFVNLNGLFEENAKILADIYNCEVINNIYMASENETIIVFGSHSSPLEILNYKTEKNVNYIIIQTENLNSTFAFNDNYIKLLKMSTVWDWSYYNKDVLKIKYDISVDDIYTFKFYKIVSDKKRTIDLFFCGGHNKNRKTILSNIQKKFPNLNCKFILDYNLCDNKELTEILKITKVVLNIPFYQQSVLATHRINKALACGCQVYSIPSCDKILDEQYEKCDNVEFDENLINLIEKNFKSNELQINLNE